jgi:hypothetical protein
MDKIIKKAFSSLDNDVVYLRWLIGTLIAYLKNKDLNSINNEKYRDFFVSDFYALSDLSLIVCRRIFEEYNPNSGYKDDDYSLPIFLHLIEESNIKEMLKKQIRSLVRKCTRRFNSKKFSAIKILANKRVAHIDRKCIKNEISVFKLEELVKLLHLTTVRIAKILNLKKRHFMPGISSLNNILLVINKK